MTICIAAIAANISAVIVTSDRMLSAHFLSLEFDHPDSKIEKIGKSCVGLSSGDALPAGELFASAHSVSTQLQNPQVGQIAESIKRTLSKKSATAGSAHILPSHVTPRNISRLRTRSCRVAMPIVNSTNSYRMPPTPSLQRGTPRGEYMSNLPLTRLWRPTQAQRSTKTV